MDRLSLSSEYFFHQERLIIDQQFDKQTEEAAESVRESLERVFREIDSPEKARAVTARLTGEKEEQPAVEVAEKLAPAGQESPEARAQAIADMVTDAATSDPDETRAAAVILEEAAAAATTLDGPAYEALVKKIQEVTGPALEGQPEKLEKSRRYFRDAIMHHPSVTFLDKYDTELFIFLNNHTPRTPLIEGFFKHLSFVFNGGWAWIIGTALFWPFYPGRVKAILKQITLPILAATLIVEGPIKLYFRRKRPFIDIVRAIVVGKKPGNWSFPSGHSAAAFAGARMLSRCLPRRRGLWYTIAGLVGFSRIYLGAHYPGDVLTGSISGFFLAEGARWFLGFIGRRLIKR